MKSFIAPAYLPYKKELTHFVKNFDREGEIFGDQPRNTLKLFQMGDKTLNIKSFKKPNLINKFAYRFLRKSKAQRSFEYAQILLNKGIKTPQPVAYFEQQFLLFGKSYYISEHLNYDMTYRDLIYNEQFPNRYEILKCFTRFTFALHEKGIEFLDHSPGNTLIVVNDQNEYEFYLVDLNRMRFHQSMSYAMRIKNFSRLTADKNMILTMSAEYAKLIHKNFETVFNDMWGETQKFRRKFYRKRQLKKRLGK